jgi:hypothetical protein
VTDSGAESIDNDTDETLTFDTEGTDTHGFWVIGSPSRLTVPADEGGDYWPEVYVSFAADADGYRQVTILKNGSPIATHTVRLAASPTLATVISQIFPAVTLVATDYLELRVHHTAGAALNVEAGAGFGMRRGQASSGAVLTPSHNHTATANDGGVLTDDEHDGFSEYAAISTPSTPASNKVRLYANTDALWSINDAGNTRPVSGAMVLLDEVVVGGAGAANIAFSGIAGTYRSLKIIWAGRTTNASAQAVGMQFNADTAANYDSESADWASTTGTAFQAVAATSIRIGAVVPSGAPAGNFTQGEIVIYNYANTNYNTDCSIRSSRVDAHSSGNVHIEIDTGHWRSTAAITAITLTPAAGNFPEHSRATLYGIM